MFNTKVTNHICYTKSFGNNSKIAFFWHSDFYSYVAKKRYTPLCASLVQNDRKMRPSKIHFLGLQNSKTYQKMQKILKFHDGLQTFLLTSASRAALLGRWAGTGQQVTLKAIVEVQIFSLERLYTTIKVPRTLQLGRPHFSSIRNNFETQCCESIVHIVI